MSGTGSIDLYQDATHWTDIDGSLHILGGTMTIHGGTGSSQWAYLAAASLEMNAGTLEFDDFGVIVTNNNSLTEYITGGTIITPGGFSINRNDFTPTGGTVEFTGTSDCSISNNAGSNFFNVIIAKTEKLPSPETTGKPIRVNQPPSGDLVSEPNTPIRAENTSPGTRSSTVIPLF